MFRKLGCLVVILSIGSLYLSGLPVVKKYRYPLKYEKLIRASAKENNVRSTLIAAIIRQESGFKPAIVSKAGAIGLMQLIPDTASWIAGKQKESFNPDKLVDPETNISYGTWYFRYLLDRYNNDEDLALAAYNSGTRLIDRLNGQEVTLKSVYTETYQFVINVKALEKIYSGLYGSNLTK